MLVGDDCVVCIVCVMYCVCTCIGTNGIDRHVACGFVRQCGVCGCVWGDAAQSCPVVVVIISLSSKKL